MKVFITAFRRAMRGHMKYVYLFIPVSLLMATVWIGEPLYARYAIDTMTGALEGESVPFVRIFFFWFLIFLAFNAVNALGFYVRWAIQHDLLAQTRQMYYERVLKLDIKHHVTARSGELMKTIDNAADAIVDLMRQIFLELLPAAITAVIFVTISFLISWQLTLVILGLIPIFALIVTFSVRLTRTRWEFVNRLWVQSLGRGYDSLANIFTVKSSGAEDREILTMQETHRKGIVELRKVNITWSIFEGIGFFMMMRLCLIAYGMYLLVHNQLTLGSLFFYQFAFFRMVMPLEMVSNMMPRWSELLGKVKLAEELFQKEITIESKPGAKEIPDLKGAIRFSHVQFSYGGADTLKDIDLEIKPGQHIALVGHSGAGKSTIAMLLNRFYDVTGGQITIDGVDIRDIDMQWWRRQIGLVLQENIMFNDTVKENIRYSRPDASDAEVEDAARRASIGFISNLPQGFDTQIGERGIRLSGGERQRVAIARAILKQPKIVILDEATSALDSVTEREVQRGIAKLIAGRTAVIIAHRLSTVRSVDAIAVLENGQLIAFGPHEKLMKECTPYRRMVELQSEGLLADSET